MKRAREREAMQNETEAKAKARQKAEEGLRQLTILTTSMTMSFYLSWTPYAFNCILNMAGVLIPHVANIIAILFAKCGTVINPTLYIFCNKGVSKC